MQRLYKLHIPNLVDNVRTFKSCVAKFNASRGRFGRTTKVCGLEMPELIRAQCVIVTTRKVVSLTDVNLIWCTVFLNLIN